MKKMVFAGKFDGDEEKLPRREHKVGAVPFREPEQKRFAVLANTGGILLSAVMAVFAVFHGGEWIAGNMGGIMLACIAPMLTLIPHELLHALCFRETVYMYSNLRQGMMFVVGTETMSKARFIWMSLFPNIVFGIAPFIIGLIFPRLALAGVFGGLCTGMGFGDYINVWNAATQMPKGARTYLHGFHSYWYK